MSKKLFVGNIEWTVSEDQLKAEFEAFGPVEEAIIIRDRQTGKSKGFGFVTYQDDMHAQEAVAQMNGKELNGRKLHVNEARPK